MKSTPSKRNLDAASRERLRDRRLIRQGVLGVAGSLIVGALLTVVSLSGYCGEESGGVSQGASTMAIVGVVGTLTGPIRDQDGDGGDGGGDGDDLDPQAKQILARIDEQKKTFERIEKEVGEIPELKKQAEEFDKAVKEFEGLDSDVKEVSAKLKALDKRMNQVKTDAAGDPLKRILGDEEMRSLITAPARAAYLRANNKPVPEELEKSVQRAMQLGEKRAVDGGSSPGSGYIDDELLANVYQLAAQYGIWSGFDVVRPGTRQTKIPVDTSDPDMLKVNEGASASEESYTGTTVTNTMEKILGWIGVTNEMLEDDEIGLANHLLTKFFRSFGKRMDHFCLNADGTDDGTNGGFTGIFQGGTTFNAATGNTSIATLDFADFTDLLAGADEALGSLPTTRWWMHPQVLVQLLAIKDSNGRPIFLTATEAPTPGGIGSILGVPVIRANAAPKTDGTSQPIAVYGDSMGLSVGVRRDFEFASSTQAKFVEDKTVFRARARAGVIIKDATAFEVMTTAAS